MHESRSDRPTVDSTVPAGSTPLARLKDLNDYRVADGDEDIRGWEVRTPDGRKVGKVEELIIDTSALKARYMEVKVDKDITDAAEDRWAFVPVGTATLNEKQKQVVIDRFPTNALFTADERKRQALSREVELSLREEYGVASTRPVADKAPQGDDDFYADALYDEERLRRKRESEVRRDAYISRQEGDTDRRI